MGTFPQGALTEAYAERESGALLDAAAVGLEHGVDAALGLVAAAPAAGTGVFARLDLGSAGHAADRRVALGHQWVHGTQPIDGYPLATIGCSGRR